jgi:hypothetical protein
MRLSTTVDISTHDSPNSFEFNGSKGRLLDDVPLSRTRSQRETVAAQSLVVRTSDAGAAGFVMLDRHLRRSRKFPRVGLSLPQCRDRQRSF